MQEVVWNTIYVNIINGKYMFHEWNLYTYLKSKFNLFLLMGDFGIVSALEYFIWVQVVNEYVYMWVGCPWGRLYVNRLHMRSFLCAGRLYVRRLSMRSFIYEEVIHEVIYIWRGCPWGFLFMRRLSMRSFYSEDAWL